MGKFSAYSLSFLLILGGNISHAWAQQSQEKEDLKKQDTVPAVPERQSLPDQNATQEPSAKLPGTAQRAEILWNGALTAVGAPKDVDTVPSLYSERTAADDKLPTVAYTLRHLTSEQKSTLYRQLRGAGRSASAAAATTNDDFAVIGAEVPTVVALNAVEPLPADVTSRIPEMRGVAYIMSGNKLVLIDADSRIVIGILTE